MPINLALFKPQLHIFLVSDESVAQNLCSMVWPSLHTSRLRDKTLGHHQCLIYPLPPSTQSYLYLILVLSQRIPVQALNDCISFLPPNLYATFFLATIMCQEFNTLSLANKVKMRVEEEIGRFISQCCISLDPFHAETAVWVTTLR